MKKMMKLKSCLLFFLILYMYFWKLSNGYRIATYRATYKSIRDNRFETTNSLGDYTVSDKYECLRKCGLNSQCLTFFYHETKKRCILHSILFSTTIPSKSGAGWKLYNNADETRRCPPQNGLIYYKDQDFCVKFFGGKVKMNYAANVIPKCTNAGLQLVRIDSAAKNHIIMNNIGTLQSGNHVCIQGTNSLTGSYSTWTFDDRTLMPYFSWDPYYNPNQPENRAGEPCIVIARNGGYWHDFSCNAALYCFVVCESIS